MTATAQTLVEIRDAIAAGEITSTNICSKYLERIAAVDGSLNAFNNVTSKQALERAAAVDRSRTADDPRPLLGVPIAIKDNLCTRGVTTTASSRILKNFVPPYDATVVSRLEAAGAIVLGKTNCDEFGMGSSNENSAFGPVKNPWDLTRSPGGSSGGAAAAVSARLVPGALGSDTGGSIRQPAALCGVVGLKPTYGRVSRYGLLAFASSLDQVGPLTLTVRDAALLLEVIAGSDPRDATTAPQQVPHYIENLDADLRGVRLGVPSALLDSGIDPEVSQAFSTAVEVFQSTGATVSDIALPHAQYAIPVYYLLATAEASSNLARYDGVRYTYRAELDPTSTTLRAMYDQTRSEGFGEEVKRRIMLGTYALSAGYYDAYYLKAQQVRTLILRDYEQAFDSVDAVIMPTSPVPAFTLGEKIKDPLQMYLLDIFTVSANLAGLPAISVPAGFTQERLPVGIQLVGRAFDEGGLLKIARAYERNNGWWKETPSI
jgi:aspartyl-tRNA(Asn)/glutamyl-tRNA(Gln) amidotransferase subunit A